MSGSEDIRTVAREKYGAIAKQLPVIRRYAANARRSTT